MAQGNALNIEFSINDLIYANTASTLGALTTANSAMLVTNHLGVPSFTASLTDGQILIGATGGTPAAASLVAGSGVTITPGANSLTISATGSGGTVTSVTGTANRITSTGGTTPVIDISASYVGQSSITTLGTITTGVWQGTLVSPTYGGSGVSNPTAHGVLIAEGSSAFVPIVLAAGQVLIGTTAGDPVAAAINSGTGILVGNASGSITISNTGVTSIAGTANRITASASTGGVTLDISAAYVGQSSITTLGTITTGVWNGTVITGTYGGTGINNGTSTITLGGNILTAGDLTLAGAFGATFNFTALTNVTFPTSGTLATTAGTVSSVSGTLNRITSTGGTTPVIDISAAYVGQASITMVGTITTGVWNGTIVTGTYGGTGVNNGASTITIAGNLSTVGAFTAAFTMTGNTAVTFPTSGTLATTAGTVSSVTGTANRITSTGGTTPVIDISAAYVGQASITTLGTITTGVWNGTTVDVSHGGTGNTTFTAYSLICAGTTATGAFQNVSGLGSSGQVLTSNGAGALPTWQSNAAATGRLTSFQILTSGSGATYTRPAGITNLLVECIGGGGGGAGCAGVVGQFGTAGGGGAGGYCRKWITSAAATYTYTIGSAGAAGSSGNNAGGNGTNTTFSGGTMVASAGTGAAAGSTGVPNCNLGGAGGAASGGDINMSGQSGDPGISAGNYGIGGNGGNSVYGGGAAGLSAQNSSSAGQAATANSGAGGSGGSVSNVNASVAGGAGGSGIIIVWEYS